MWTPRSYQVEMFEAASRENCLVCLNTGAGKTFVAVMLIKSMAHQIKGTCGDGDWKRTVFLVPSVPLVHQQANVIKTHSALRVGAYTGDLEVDNWSLDMWTTQFNSFDVLVMTAQILVNTLHCAFISMSNINLLIFDECHNAIGGHPYAQVMMVPSDDPPQILGLTASMVNRVIKGATIDVIEDKLEEEIQRYEKIYHSRCVTASDHNKVLEYSGRPTECILGYAQTDHLNVAGHPSGSIREKLESVRSFIETLRDNAKDEPDAISKSCGVILKQINSIIRQLQDILDDVGIIGVYEAAKKFKKSVVASGQDPLNQENKIWFELGNSMLEKIIMSYEVFAMDIFPVTGQLTYVEPYISNKVAVLYEELSRRREGLSCIVFVKTRCKAVVLSNILNAMSKEKGTDDTLQSRYILGHTAGVNVELADITMKANAQQRIVSEFRSQVFSILVSTSVVEEGLDVRSCNLVVRFDGLLHYREYIQSKGRARQKLSHFLFMAPRKEVRSSEDKIKLMNAMEEALSRICKKRDVVEVNAKEWNFDIDPYVPYGNGGPRITQHSSVSMLNTYCSVSQRSSKYPPQYKVKVTDDGRYGCVVTLPVNCPLKEDIMGELTSSSDLARQSAAIVACRRLHEIGELDDHLLPKRRICAESSTPDTEDIDDGQTVASGTKKRTRKYDIWVPRAFSSAPPGSTPRKLYRVQMHIKVRTDSKRLEPWKIKTRCFGLLLPRDLPKIPEFPLFSNDSVISVEVSPVDHPIPIDDAILSRFRLFHDRVFTKFAGKHLKEATYSPQAVTFDVIVVPLCGGEGHGEARPSSIDFDLMDTVLNSGASAKPVLLSNLPNCIEYYRDAVVSTPYRDKVMNYIVLDVDKSLTPTSPLSPTETETFQNYYKRSYDRNISPEQPLLHVVYCPSDTQLLAPRRDPSANGHSSSKRSRRNELLLPELCPRDPFPASLYCQGVYVPAALYRLKCIMHAVDVRALIDSEAGRPQNRECPAELSESHFKAPTCSNSTIAGDINKAFASFGEILQVRFGASNSTSPLLVSMLQAITTSNARAGYDSESLEILGDSFLKQAVSIFLYSHSTNESEYLLSQERMRMVRNKTLWKLACNKGLSQFIVDKPMYIERGSTPADESIAQYLYRWLLPGYVDAAYGEGNPEQDPKDGAAPQQELSDKVVADCVEAIIGAHFVDNGATAAMEFKRWIGLDTFAACEDQPQSSSHYANYPLPKTSAINGLSSGPEVMSLYDGYRMASLEIRLGYVFRDKSFLVQALTHPSFYQNKATTSYERLEFLGDALLDFLVTFFIVHHFGEVLPGKLTDLRQALVNNNTFGLLAIKHGYHKCLLQLAPVVFQDVRSFVDRLPSIGDPVEKLLKNPFIVLFDDTDEGTHVPKCLGDIFESVAAAVFLDSGMDLATTWRVYEPMMSGVIKQYVQDVPSHPVRQLFEKCAKANFSFLEKDSGDDVVAELSMALECCTVSALDRSVRAMARNRKDAKAAAAYVLLQALEEQSSPS